MATKDDIIIIASKLFDDYDTDSSGSIDRKEMKTVVTELFKQINDKTICSEARLNKLFNVIDANSDDRLSKKEFRKLIEHFLDPTSLGTE